MFDNKELEEQVMETVKRINSKTESVSGIYKEGAKFILAGIKVLK